VQSGNHNDVMGIRKELQAYYANMGGTFIMMISLGDKTL
jgi:hypothetical protein